MKSPNIDYLPAIDHLRGLAALLIVFYHGLHVISYRLRFGAAFGFDGWLQPANPLLAALAEGHTAVSLFMVLSGFIFTIGALGRGISTAGFLRNRFLRTYPLFLAVLLFAMLWAPQRVAPLPLLQTLLALGNLRGSLDIPPFTSMFWTIAVEWHFYLLFPLLLRGLERHGPRALLAVLALAFLLRVGALAAGYGMRDLGYLTIFGRIDQFLAGMLAGVIYRSGWRPAGGWLPVLCLSGTGIFAALWALNGAGGWPVEATFRIGWGTLEAALWGAFVLGWVGSATRLPATLSRVLAAIGTISYSMYLLHFIVIDAIAGSGLLLQPAGASPAAAALLSTALLVLPVTLLLSALSYRLVERPFLRLRGVYARGSAAAG